MFAARTTLRRSKQSVRSHRPSAPFSPRVEQHWRSLTFHILFIAFADCLAPSTLKSYQACRRSLPEQRNTVSSAHSTHHVHLRFRSLMSIYKIIPSARLTAQLAHAIERMPNDTDWLELGKLYLLILACTYNTLYARCALPLAGSPPVYGESSTFNLQRSTTEQFNLLAFASNFQR